MSENQEVRPGDEGAKKVKSFEDLRIWQDARTLLRDIYSDFGKGSKGEHDFEFKNQVQGAGISIVNNIAEGFERTTDVEFARFLDIAKGSCGEVRSMYYSAEDLGYVSSAVAVARREQARTISRGIAALASHLRR